MMCDIPDPLAVWQASVTPGHKSVGNVSCSATPLRTSGFRVLVTLKVTLVGEPRGRPGWQVVEVMTKSVGRAAPGPPSSPVPCHASEDCGAMSVIHTCCELLALQHACLVVRAASSWMTALCIHGIYAMYSVHTECSNRRLGKPSPYRLHALAHSFRPQDSLSYMVVHSQVRLHRHLAVAPLHKQQVQWARSTCHL